MFARAATGSMIGVDAHSVMVEAHRAKGLPGLALIGLARGAAKEALVRVRSALTASGYKLGTHRVVVNLLPAELPKEASGLDLPLALALLTAAGLIEPSALEGRRFYGELSLGGGLEPVSGGVLLADLVRRAGESELVLPLANAAEAAVIPGVRVFGAQTLDEVVQHATGAAPLARVLPGGGGQGIAGAGVSGAAEGEGAAGALSVDCLSEVRGQERAKRALKIAAAGGHNLLMIGPPGSGKTMLARRLLGLLPELTPDEQITVTRIHSAAGSSVVSALAKRRPFRSPHHTASDVALCGGGGVPRPGEITLAHRGVLFLDELPEFSRRALESLREPLENGMIHIARANRSLTFPAEFLLIAAMNPCPCGRYGSKGPTPCLCNYEQVQRYRGRISGPLLDRIDLHVHVDAVPFRDFLGEAQGETSAAVRKRVLAARDLQSKRLGLGNTNSRMDQRDTLAHVALASESLGHIEEAMHVHGLSTRAIGRAMKVARTIADLDGTETVTPAQIQEAIGYRLLDGPLRPAQG